MTAAASSAANSFNHGVKCITADASVNLVYDSKARRRFYQSTGKPKRTEQNLIVRIGESLAEVTNSLKDCSQGMCC